MADIRPVREDFAVAPQVRPEEVAGLAERFRTLINNRPDDEEPGQPSSAELAAAAAKAGVAYHHVPIAGAPGFEQVEIMRSLLDGAERPALAFCRSGTRSITAWALGEALAGRPEAEVAAEGRAAGYELAPALTALLPRLRSA